VPLSEIRSNPHGAVYRADPPIFVQPGDPDCTDRLDVGNAQMMSDLTDVASESALGDDPVTLPDGELLDFRFVCRRLQQAYNSSGRALRGMRNRHYNPAFMHPDDLERLGLRSGDLAEIRSERASITAVVEADDNLRRGLVSMTHAFGGLPEHDGDLLQVGANVGRLLNSDDGLEPYTLMPRMSNEPVSVRALSG
jgi:anaerobic selenocysteine-containing dehydrogenase